MTAPTVPFPQLTIRKAVIPAAGLGTRLRPLSRALPKEMLPVGRKPVLAWVADELRRSGITDALFVVSERKTAIRAYFGEMYTGDEDAPDALPPLRCAYVTQTEQRGLGDALLYAEAWTGGESFAVAFGDCIIETADEAKELPLQRLIATHIGQVAAATVLTEIVAPERVSRYGIVAPSAPLMGAQTAPFRCRGIVEKPAPDAAPSNRAVAARWLLTPAIFDALRACTPDARGEIGLTEAVQKLCAAGGDLWAVPLLPGEARRDIGNFETFFAAFVREALRDPEYGAATRRIAREMLANFNATNAGKT